MKGMQKISRGGSFSGVMAYAFDGDLDNPRELEGQVVGGNMSGYDPKSLTREFNASKAVRPDVVKPVWHNSLRLPEGEKLSPEKWAEIGDAYMQKMGFSEHHQRVYVLHDDKAGQHIHIVASRIGLDGKLFLGKNENLISTKKIAELEKEFNLTITKGANYDSTGKVVMPDQSRPRKGEVGLFERTGEAPKRSLLTALIDKSIADKPSASVFAERLVMAGVEVRANFSKDTLNGFSFSIEGVPFKGSQLGKQYTGKALFERGLSYEQSRDYEALKQYSSAGARNRDDSRATENDKGHEPGRRPGDGREPETVSGDNEVDASGIRRVDGEGTDSAFDSASGDDPANSGRDDAPGAAVAESERSDHVDDHSAGSGGDRPAVDSKPTAAGDNTAATAPALGSSGGQPADAAGGGISAGTQVSNIGTAKTGDEATDRMISLFDQATSKLASEAMSRAKKQQAEDEAAGKKRMRSDRQAISALFSLLDRVADPQSRHREVKNFAQAVGANKFEVAFHDPSNKRKTIQKTLTAEQLQNPDVIRKLTNYSAQNFDVFVRPAADSGGAILLQGLSAADVQKLEAIGLQPAATINAGGKLEAWIKVDEKLSEDEHKALKKRLAEIVGVPQSGAGFGRLTGYSRGAKCVTLTDYSGQTAPAVAGMLEEIKAEIEDAKATAKMSLKLEQIVVTRSQLDAHSFPDVAGIKTLKKGWFREARDEIEGDCARNSVKAENHLIEDKLLQAMARQKVPAKQAYSAVVAGSRVDNSETHAALSVSLAYTRVALEREGKKLDGIDLAKAAQERFPELMKQAESGLEAQQKAIIEDMKQAGMEEQKRLEQREAELAEERRLAVEAQRKLEEEDKLKKG